MFVAAIIGFIRTCHIASERRKNIIQFQIGLGLLFLCLLWFAPVSKIPLFKTISYGWETVENTTNIYTIYLMEDCAYLFYGLIHFLYSLYLLVNRRLEHIALSINGNIIAFALLLNHFTFVSKFH